MSLEDVIGAFRTGHYIVTRQPDGVHVDGEYVLAALASDVEITAVDADLDTLTSTAHGLSTGDGPYRLVDARGQLDTDDEPRLPEPLVIGDEYFVIVVDVDTLQLAVSNADAIALVAIDITSIPDDSVPFTASPSRFMIEANIQPLTGRVLAGDEDADRTSEDSLCLVVEELFIRKPGREPDVVEVDDESWTVTVAEKWDHWGGRHYECTISRDEAT